MTGDPGKYSYCELIKNVKQKLHKTAITFFSCRGKRSNYETSMK